MNHTFSKKTPQKGIYLYGRHPVSLALQNKKRRILELFLLKGALDEKLIPPHIPVHFSSRDQLEQLVGKDAVHQGVVALCSPLEKGDLDNFISTVQNQKKALVVILDQVSDPHNIGAILRSAAAFNVSAVIIPETGAPNETGVLAKSACGALELVPLIRVGNLVRAMEKLKKADFWCIGMDGYATKSIYDDHLPRKCALVMGSEGDGLRRLTAETCDDTIKLPINPIMESLNVSNATAIALYEWNRQQYLNP